MTNTKERPILFKGEMVRAILDGRKTQTRRVLKVQPLDILPMNAPNRWVTLETREPEPHERVIKCRLGVPGDKLWVRETWQVDPAGEWGYCYKATGHNAVCGWHSHLWRPSIFMPRKASRITLEIVNVRVQRLQDITEADAIAEGAEPLLVPPDGGSCPHIEGYRALWESINGAGSWDANPYVWVIEFKRLSTAQAEQTTEGDA